MQNRITIAGGGLAGLTLGLMLRSQDVPVEIWDAGTYPRHRVCGEFISGRGLEILLGLGLPKFPEPLGAYARSVRFFAFGRTTKASPLPIPALSINRAVLDHLLADEFRKRGGTLRENSRWVDSFAADGLVRATGRRINRDAEQQFIGLKVHVQDLALSADLELHFSREGYVGLSRQKDGTVNMCGLFRKRNGLDATAFRDRTAFERIVARERQPALKEARLQEETFSAVAGVSLKRELNLPTNECRIGDSISMIAPLTGNGMSFAIESASVAAPILREYAVGTSSWVSAQRRISQACENQFRRRFLVAAILQKAAFTTAGRVALLGIFRTVPRFLESCFFLTR